MRPQAAHAGHVVLELRELDLELALGAVRVPGEDVEDHRGAVDDRHPELLLEVALLARAELVVAGDDVRVGRLRGLLDLDELAGAEVRVRMRLLAVLDDLPDDRDAGGAQQLAQLGEVVARPRARRCRTRAASRVPGCLVDLAVLAGAALSRSLHRGLSLVARQALPSRHGRRAHARDRAREVRAERARERPREVPDVLDDERAADDREAALRIAHEVRQVDELHALGVRPLGGDGRLVGQQARSRGREQRSAGLRRRLIAPDTHSAVLLLLCGASRTT